MSEAAQKKVEELINDNAVMVFSKSYCPYCNKTKSTLKGLGAKFTAYELDLEDDGADIQAALKVKTNQSSVPNIFIGKEHKGGNSDLQDLLKEGKLPDLLKNAGAVA